MILSRPGSSGFSARWSVSNASQVGLERMKAEADGQEPCEEEEMEALEATQMIEEDVPVKIQALSAQNTQQYWEQTENISPLIREYIGKQVITRHDSESTEVNPLSNAGSISTSTVPFPTASETTAVQSTTSMVSITATPEAPVCASNSFKKNSIPATPISLGKRKSIFADFSVTPSRNTCRKLEHNKDMATASRREITEVIEEETDDPFVCNGYPAVCKKQPIDVSPSVVIVDLGWYCSYLNALPVGVQWEICRLITLGRIKLESLVVEKFRLLQGSDSEMAPKVVQLFIPQVNKSQDERDVVERVCMQQASSRSPFVELDREEEAIRSEGFQMLGGIGNWYGGKIEFTASLRIEKDKSYRLVLQRLTLGHSTRLARRFGSSRFLRIKISKASQSYQCDLRKEEANLMAYFCRPFVISGRVYQAFFAKDSTVFLVETLETIDRRTNEVSEKLKKALASDLPRKNLLEFVKWMIPFEGNEHQTMAKLCARVALSLSNSAPGIQLPIEQIEEIPEIYSSAWDHQGKAPPAYEMTDGCGFANIAVFKQLKDIHGWQELHTAVQCRIRGSKGMLTLHPNGWIDKGKPKIWLRPSQCKIKYPEDYVHDPSNLIIDTLRASHLKSPASLSAETIINLAENGVPKSVFINLMQDGMKAIADALMDWEGDHAMLRLWHTIDQIGGVSISRRAREAGGAARIQGLGDRDRAGDADLDDVDDNDVDALKFDAATQERSLAYSVDEISGCPSTMEEQAMRLIDAGFRPQECGFLAHRIRKILDNALTNYSEQYRIEVTKSCTAQIIPDPLGVLKEGEIHIKSSHRLTGPDGTDTNVIEGDVLVTRHPCKVPTDVQKVKAVYRQELAGYEDQIIFSVQGERSLASMLGGGDYDGDKVLVIWDPTVVEPFTNADPKFANPPEDLDDQFIKNKETVAEFLERVKDTSDATKTLKIQEYLLAGLRDTSIVGMYSIMHDFAVYRLGYFHPETIRLAYTFCAVLDGSKTGLTVKPDVLSRDKRAYLRRPPAWKGSTVEDRDKAEKMYYNQPSCLRTGAVSRLSFIMDSIQNQGKKERDQHLEQYEKLVNNLAIESKFDDVLAGPWQDAEKKAKETSNAIIRTRKLEELKLIADHVRNMRFKYRDLVAQNDPKTPGSPSKSGIWAKKIEVRQDLFRNLSKEFAGKPDYKKLDFFDETALARIRASYAYYHDYHELRVRKWSLFPYTVAMKDLCAIKAGPSFKAVSANHYYAFRMGSHVKASVTVKASS